MNGPLRITVLDKDAYYDQRVVVRTPYGTFVLEGRTGASLDVRADDWEMELQHCVPGVGWRPNVRVLPYPWQTSRSGLRSRIVRSKDCDWPNGDPTERNLILRLSATVAERPGEAASPTEGLGPATRDGMRTSGGGAVGVVGGQAPAAARATVAGQDAAAVPAAPVAGVPAYTARTAYAATAVPGVPAHGGVPGYGASTVSGTVSGTAAVAGEVPAAGAGQYGALVPAVRRDCGNVQPQAARLSVGRVLPAESAAPVAAAPSRPAVTGTPLTAPVATAPETWASGR
ncbi:hypothetical protein ACFVFS_12635 [Kitasatospora sp. NPDC057692]|uniref:hypothetical protein n=1 Tax=Kitasatospora sp. NPDC057692 TaxID=3346215 RepID=UPI00368C1BCD